MEKLLKIFISVIISGGVGYIIGYFSRKLGSSCSLTSTPWDSIITGILF
ncbi:MAG: DUF6132 family protein [Elusimicrobiota bacterium]|nr:DUF6132 family protein [Endomicrobiia bacterium]MCX7910830.1 DUF6132 family protein [Endomicrobiia bacterium]MDW8166519.1 DUF6132 family protein [Elusimicrobiota bacterium]